MKRNFILSLIALSAIFQVSAYPNEGVFGAIGDSFDALITEQMQLLTMIQTLTNCCGGSIVATCTPITQADIPITINAPGDYCVTENLNGNSTLITVAASNVNIDLGGFTLDGNNTAASCISISANSDNIHICNGTLDDTDTTGFGNGGLATAGPVNNLTLANITSTNHRDGFSLVNCTSLLIRECSALNNVSGVFCLDSNGSIEGDLSSPMMTPANFSLNSFGCFLQSSEINFANCEFNNNSTTGMRFNGDVASYLTRCQGSGNGSFTYDSNGGNNQLLFYNCQNTGSANFALNNNVALDMSGNTP